MKFKTFAACMTFATLLCVPGAWTARAAAPLRETDPYSLEAGRMVDLLQSGQGAHRARAAEALGYMRYYPAEAALIAALNDDRADVRRNAALSLGWCGGRESLLPLAQRLEDDDWNVRQSAWVALNSLSGMQFPFDALAEPGFRTSQADTWRAWLAALPENGLPPEVLALLASEDHYEAERGARAAGVLGGREAVERIIESVERWTEIEDEEDAEAKWRVQGALRALGRSGRPEALPVLVQFLDNQQWARYAADGLGDFGGEEAAAALLDAFPQYARDASSIFSGSVIPSRLHPSDRGRFDSRDRVLAAPYAIAFSLSRLPFESPENMERLRRVSPQLAAQLPLDIDGLVVYEEEPHQRIVRHLLERAEATQWLLDAAFSELGQPRARATGAIMDVCNEEDDIPFRSPVLRGGEEAHRVEVDITGWQHLYLVLDEVEDYYHDRANWAEARVVDADGAVVYLDEMAPVTATQQHDQLRVNRSANFEDLRIGPRHFERGLHTHAYSVIHYALDGRFSRFEAWAGICSSKNPGQGSVQFVVRDTAPERQEEQRTHILRAVGDPAYASNIIASLCRDPEDVPRLIALLDHANHWVRINAAKTLVFIEAPEAVEAIGERLRASKPEAEYGFFNEPYFSIAQGQDEFDDHTPRYREAFIVALGQLGATSYVPLLERLLFDERNALEIQHAAARALDSMNTGDAVDLLKRVERAHPYHSVRMVAREALWNRGEQTLPRPDPARPPFPRVDAASIPERPTRFIFIKGDHIPYNPFQMDSWRQAYMTTDSGPTYRPGRNLYVLDISGDEPHVVPLTRFEDGYVADCEVTYDGERVLFSRRAEDNPWWHLYEIGADGAGLRQLTDGPYHDVQPTPLPNGRIAFSSTRLGARDEYHGYLSTGLATMHPDGSDIQVIGFNVGRDAEPTVADDGALLFTRLELFYSRMKTEFNLLRAFPDGTRMETLYGPERRELWSGIHGGYGNWGTSGDRHRQLRLVQPRAHLPNQHLLITPAGPIITKGRHAERFIRESFLRSGGNDPWVITTPHKIDENTLLVAAGKKNHEMVRDEFPRDPVDLGLYYLDVPTGELTLLYNDPDVAAFEARPLHPRKVPPVLPDSPQSHGSRFTSTLYANSVFATQQQHVPKRGRLLRVIEGQPQVARHITHNSSGDEEAWKNHGGTFARVLGTVPLASDGSFAVEVPADRLLHLQVLDGDRNVVGNQTVWMHARPGEVKGCVGCHEPPQTAALPPVSQGSGSTFVRNRSIFDHGPPPSTLPDGSEQLRYRAKMWFKGYAPDEREERQRTVQAINWFGRP